MTIAKDIWRDMRAAPGKPIGLALGVSGWKALEAEAVRIARDGNRVERFVMRRIRALALSKSGAFPGFDLMIDDKPNPHAPGGRMAA